MNDVKLFTKTVDENSELILENHKLKNQLREANRRLERNMSYDLEESDVASLSEKAKKKYIDSYGPIPEDWGE